MQNSCTPPCKAVRDMSFLCSFCGRGVPTKSGCTIQACVDAHARIPETRRDSIGIPRSKWCQSEPERVRKQHMFRLIPQAGARIAAAARKEGITKADYLERWALTLPPVE